MPTSKIKAVLNELAIAVGGNQGKLIADLGELLEEAFNTQSNNAVALMQNIELGLVGHLDLLRKEVNDLKSLLLSRQNTLERTVDDQHSALRSKLHSVSNFIVSLEGKIDEVMELLTSKDEDANP